MKRIAYLCFHVAGRDVELPVFRKLGIEVYTVKKFNKNHRSGAANYDDDADLTIPKHVIDYLNTVNFVDGSDWPLLASKYLNEYFDAVFIIQNANVVKSAIVNFRGQVIVRIAGLDVPKSYTNYFNHFQPGLMKQIIQNQERIWFSLQYENLTKVEDPVFAERGVFMPLGIPSAFKEKRGTWAPSEEPRLITVIPSLEAPYYQKKYNRLKSIAGHLNHRILGTQTRVYKDRSVVGSLPMSEYIREFQEASALIYDSFEPRHVHFPPFEAATVGTPVLFFAPSLLADLSGPKAVGQCHNEAEMTKKAERILGGDQSLIDDIRKSQTVMLEKFADDFVFQKWKAAFDVMRQPMSLAKQVNEKSNSQAKVLSQRNNSRRFDAAFSTCHGYALRFVNSNVAVSEVIEHLFDEPKAIWVRIDALCAKDQDEVVSLSLSDDENIQIDCVTFSRIHSTSKHVTGDIYEQTTFWKMEQPFSRQASQIQKCVFTVKTKSDEFASGHIKAQISKSEFQTGTWVKVNANRRAQSGLLWRGFDTSNPHGLDVINLEGDIFFLLPEGLQRKEAMLRLSGDTYQTKEPYEVVVKLNNRVLGIISSHQLKHEIVLPIKRGLTQLNTLVFNIQTDDPDWNSEANSLHINSIRLDVTQD